MYQHQQQFAERGTRLSDAKQAIIMIHGRGASAQSILSLADHLNLLDTDVLAPQATNNSWYPFSFMAPDEQNQPALNSALDVVDNLVNHVLAAGIPREKIYLLGFSQGACLSLEYVSRNATKYGGVIAFTGGLIGEKLNLSNYTGDFQNTPVLLTTGEPDDHVPLSRVQESVSVLENLHAEVTLKVYRGRAHTIQLEEIQLANKLILKANEV